MLGVPPRHLIFPDATKLLISRSHPTSDAGAELTPGRPRVSHVRITHWRPRNLRLGLCTRKPLTTTNRHHHKERLQSTRLNIRGDLRFIGFLRPIEPRPFPDSGSDHTGDQASQESRFGPTHPAGRDPALPGFCKLGKAGWVGRF